jgi:peroxiredoxin Q/BCP
MKFKIIIAVLLIGFIGFVVSRPNDKAASDTKSVVGDYSQLVGKPAPDFTLQDYKGGTYTLSQLKGKKVVLFFNEGIMCYPACWNQVAAFGTDKDFNSDKVFTASIVPDMQAEWSQATSRMPQLAKSTILLDSDNAVSNKYGMMYLPSSMHKGGKPGHTYVIIDTKGIVRYTYDDPKMGLRDQLLKDELSKI